MGTKTGLLIGFGAGYVLGARAGRSRYEDIRRWWGQISGSPTVQRAATVTREAAATGARQGLRTVQQGVEKAGSAVRERLHKESDPNERVLDLVEKHEGQPAGHGSENPQDAFGRSP